MVDVLTDLWSKSSLTEDEKDKVVITGKDIEDTMERGKLCFVEKLIIEKKINREAFKNTMSKVWKFYVGIKIIQVGENLYIFEFQ